ncbi:MULTISPECIES: hypothetical protein [unclassified Mesorhizobium]|uniref:hypothetical protein n=1 Tax=unclassified Mesorhizobium TaxID=325217 RepID=UPI0012EC234B|nr:MULTISPECIES: hypothetical protein [unclassified Mesorhizobium]WJI54600.1 hypothetical protein NLY33_15100 [Mesorhizobium sp. C432A]
MHIMVGVGIFLALACAAFVIWEFTEWMREHNAPYWLLVICDAVAYLLFVIDVICASFFALVEGMKFVRAVWKTWKRELQDE